MKFAPFKTAQISDKQNGSIRVRGIMVIGIIGENCSGKSTPVAQMSEKKHGMFDGGTYDDRFDGEKGDPASLCEKLKARIEKEKTL